MKWIVRLIFLLVFIAFAYYIAKVETVKYESKSIVLLKDLSKQKKANLSAAIGLGGYQDSMKDSKVLELYIRSAEMYAYINNLYHLDKHYTSEELDWAQRLYKDSNLSAFDASKENYLKKYNENLHIIFDEASGTLSLSFIHTDKEIAQKILESIISYSDIVINEFGKQKAKVALDFIDKQKKINKENFNQAIKKLVTYQNKHHTIDPNLDVQRKNTILANLEGELIKLEVEYGSKSKTYNLNGSEMKILKETIRNTKKSIKRVKSQMVGSGDLNANVFKFELLRNNMEFNKELYKQVLITQEEQKLEVTQNAKYLISVSKPTLADKYSYPSKIWDIFTVFVVLIFLYNILMTIILIIKDHKD